MADESAHNSPRHEDDCLSHTRSDDRHTPPHNNEDVNEDDRFKNQIAAQVAKALENTIPMILNAIKDAVEDAFEKREKKAQEESFKSLEILDDSEKRKDKGKGKRFCSFKDYMTCKPKGFRGEIDPLISMRWIDSIEESFETTNVDPNDKITFAIAQLTDGAKDWLRVLRKSQGTGEIREMGWDNFKEKFLEQFCPTAAVDRIAEEFLAMRQDGESIDKLTNMFYDKAQFCPDLVATEKMKVNRFFAMLSREYREFVTPTEKTTLVELINKCRVREAELKRQVERGEKRKMEETSSPFKKAKYSSPSKKQSGRSDGHYCRNCGRVHPGECRHATQTCYKCGKTGHIASQCTNNISLCYNCYKPGHKKNECPELRQIEHAGKKPEASRPKGRAFQITAAEAKENPEVVTGTFKINALPALVLFDSGATRSFISVKFVDHPSFKSKRLSVPLEVEVANDRSFLVC